MIRARGSNRKAFVCAFVSIYPDFPIVFIVFIVFIASPSNPLTNSIESVKIGPTPG